MSVLTLPGLIDIHVHLRDPGQTHKEDFYTGTAAALAGGFTAVFDMPNNVTPITTRERLDEKITIAKTKAVCDIGFYFGSLGDNFEEFNTVAADVMGLKLYLNMTTGGFIISEESMTRIYEAWPSKQPILLHAEEDQISMVLAAIRKTGKKSHFCHVSSQNELQQIIKAKEEGLPVTCGVCPHHLFLTQADVSGLGAYARMKPELKAISDKEFLWKNLRFIDVIESDHAPHTREEKDSPNPPSGVPGLETTLPLLITAATRRKPRLTIDDIIRLCHTMPRQILGLPKQENTTVTVDMAEYEIQNETLQSKCKWTPFVGWNVRGKVVAVQLRGAMVYKDGALLVAPGTGSIITP